MELTQEQVNHIVMIAETYQTELEDASRRFRARLIEAGLPMGPAGRLVERERYYRPLSPVVSFPRCDCAALPCICGEGRPGC